MDTIDKSLPALSRLIEERLALVGALAESLEASTGALVRNDAEAIARGASHQAELCRQWNCLEGKLRRWVDQRVIPPAAATPAVDPSSTGIFLADRSSGGQSAVDGPSGGTISDAIATQHLVRLHAEWEPLAVRIRYLTRVHWSLLRHLQRSLAVMERVFDSCDATYTPGPRWTRTEPGLRVGE